jgi:uncharacterized repeat protein (TIGR03803 family)
MRSKKPCSAAQSIFAIFITLLLASIVVPAQTQAQKFKVLHTFHGKDGSGPISQLIRDDAGNLYGVTVAGGTHKCQDSNCGTAFKMNKSGKMIWVYMFNGRNGYEPFAGLVRDSAGNIYGTTVFGGIINSHICSLGCGVVFKLDETGRKETVLHKFTGTPDGYFPESPLVEDSTGALYGTTDLGGQGYGAVFTIDGAGKETLLYKFTCGSNGCFSDSGVVLDSSGNLYGVTLDGGAYGDGVAFKVDSAGNETVLQTFDGSNGANPDAVLLLDSREDLYGTTQNGGSSIVCDGGCGAVFETSEQGGGNLLYSFCSLSNCADGEKPLADTLVRDTAGNLYGLTSMGGAYGYGVVFKLDTAGTETVLHSFTGGEDGGGPWGGLTMDAAGNLYGATLSGGDLTCADGDGQGCGVVFKLTP